MKKFILLLFFALPFLAHSQIVTSNPLFPTTSGAVDIIFDATFSTGGLNGYTGSVYAHTGVITDKSTSPSDWKYATTWGDDNTKYKLTSLGNNKWKFNISPDIQSFYGVPAGETVQKLAFVFRDSLGNLQGKDNGADIFVDVYQSGLSVSFANPKGDQLLNANSVLNITANASSSTSMQLLLDGTTIATATNAATLSKAYTFSTPGSYWLIAEAGTTPKTVRDSIYVNVKKPQPIAPLPANVRAGINYVSDNAVTLVLYAPNKSNVFAIGDFNNWKASNNYMMNKDGDYWWIKIDNLTKGQEYGFQYQVDDSIRVADPYTDKVLDGANDPYIPSTVYPNLKAYPTGKTTGIVSVFQTGQVAYNWQTTNFVPSPKNKMVIYELLVRDFTVDHTFTSTMQKLDYLQALGVNTIELMPVSEFEGNDSWGYNPSFYFAVDKYYGTKDSYKAFVDECHKRGIAVVMDMVLNHSYNQSPFAELYWDKINNRPASDNPWYNAVSPNPNYAWGNDFNHESVATQQLVDSICSYWMGQYKVDGFRFDFTKGFTNTPGDGQAYDQSRIDILERMASQIYKRKSNAIVICEHLTDNSEETVLANADIMLWGNMNYNYCQGIMGYDGSDLSWGLYSERGWSKSNLVAYMESHDEERMMYKANTWGKVTDLAGNLKRDALSACFYFPLPGAKMIWQFGELGYDYSINTASDGVTIDASHRTDAKPIRWDYFNEANRDSLYNVYSTLIKLKKQYAVFESADVNYSLTGLQKYYVWKSADVNAFVIGNFDIAAASITVPLPKTGTWYSVFDKSSITAPSQSYTVTLQPGEYRFYMDQRVAGIEPTNGDAIYTYQNDIVTINDGVANITIYDLSGKVMEQAFLADQMNVSGLNKGVYILKIEQNNKDNVSKFLK